MRKPTAAMNYTVDLCRLLPSSPSPSPLPLSLLLFLAHLLSQSELIFFTCNQKNPD